MLGASREGHLTAFRHHKLSPTSPFDDWAEPSLGMSAQLYACPSYEGIYRLIHANTMTPTFTRGPGESTGMFALECTMDELAYELGLDPLELRLRNYADVDPASGNPWSSKGLKECYQRGAERFPGNQGVTILTLGKEQSPARYVIHRFADEAAERAWMQSEDRAKLVQEAAALSTPYTQTSSGLEAWFTLPDLLDTTPPKWKLFLAIIPSAYLASLIILLMLDAFLHGWPLLITNGMHCLTKNLPPAGMRKIRAYLLETFEEQ